MDTVEFLLNLWREIVKHTERGVNRRDTSLMDDGSVIKDALSELIVTELGNHALCHELGQTSRVVEGVSREVEGLVSYLNGKADARNGVEGIKKSEGRVIDLGGMIN